MIVDMKKPTILLDTYKIIQYWIFRFNSEAVLENNNFQDMATEVNFQKCNKGDTNLSRDHV